MDNEIAKLCDRIQQNYQYDKPIILMELEPHIKKVDCKTFLKQLFIQHKYLPFKHILLAYIDLWSNFSLKDWQNILRELSMGKRHNMLSIEKIIFFLYQYIGIDALTIYENMEVEHQDIKEEIIKDFIERPGRLITYDNNIMHDLNLFNVEPSLIEDIKQKLIDEGAYPAEKIKLENHEWSKYGVRMITVQGTIPESWYWAGKY